MRRRLLVSSLLGPLVVAAALLAQEDEEPVPGPVDVPTVASGTGGLVVDGREAPLPYSETPLGPLFALPPLVRALGGELRVGPAGQGYVLGLPNQETLLGAGSRVAVVAGEVVDLPQPPREGDGGIHVPLELLRRTYGPMLHYDFLWSPADRRLYALPQERRALDVDWNLVHLQGISTLVLQFPERPRYRVEEGDRRYRVSLLGGEEAVPAHREPVADPLVRALRFEGDEIVVEVAPDVVVEHYEQSRPFRLVFDVYRRLDAGIEGEETAGADGFGPPVIVIDPGHGGSETGAIGPSGVQEKELTLAISRLLARRLEERLPVRAILTRDEDADLPHDTRAAIANQNRAALFVSVHLNSAYGASATGAETYFLSLEASDARAAAAARQENLAAGAAAEDPARADLELILWDLAQTRYLADSQHLAAIVQEELNQALGLRDRGVKQAPFRVLMGAGMPAILVELGFISNPEEESRLQRPAYQAELVDALVRAIGRYQARLGGEAQAAVP